jgi:16S rRNA (adenine1518-N6/adenine1519-N6)-dimethyltransferase
VTQSDKDQTLGKILSNHSIRLTRRLGQHLLVNAHYLQTVIDNSDIDSVDLVLEVGPGPGNLTELLVAKAKRVLSVELDKRFCELLRRKFHDCGTFELHECDILTSGSLNPVISDQLRQAGRWGLSANLPYNVASVLIIESLFWDTPPVYICVMIQKEVAQRIASPADSKHYGVLSVLIQAWAEVKIVASVPPGAFLPPPKVHSAIIQIVYKPKLAARIVQPAFFRQFVSRLFRHRRKTLRGGWVKMQPVEAQSLIEKALTEMNIDSTRRPETLTVEEFIALSNRLAEAGQIGLE